MIMPHNSNVVQCLGWYISLTLPASVTVNTSDNEGNFTSKHPEHKSETTIFFYNSQHRNYVCGFHGTT